MFIYFSNLPTYFSNVDSVNLEKFEINFLNAQKYQNLFNGFTNKDHKNKFFSGNLTDSSPYFGSSKTKKYKLDFSLYQTAPVTFRS